MLSVAGTLAFFALWTAIAMSGLVQTQFLPTPLAVLDKFVDLTRNPFVGYTLQQHLLSSFGRFASGFVLAALVGVPLGLMMGWYRWLDDAVRAQIYEPNAMALATSTPDGRPSVRIVLLKGIDESGMTFYTNYESRKGHELEANPRAAAALLWHPLQRQVRVEGPVTRIPPGDSDAYFHSRPHGSQLGSWPPPPEQQRALAHAVRRLLEAADVFYRSGDAGLPFLPWRSRVAVATARRVYSGIGQRLLAVGADVSAPRVFVPTSHKLWYTARAALGATCTRAQQILPAVGDRPVRFPEDVLVF
jgi:hypothetical protein